MSTKGGWKNYKRNKRNTLCTSCMRYHLHELTRPFELTFEYVKADYKPFFAYYGIDMNPAKGSIEKSVQLYLNFLETL